MYDVTDPGYGSSPHDTADTRQDLFMAFFPTGSAVLSPDDRYELRKYVDRATSRFVAGPH